MGMISFDAPETSFCHTRPGLQPEDLVPTLRLCQPVLTTESVRKPYQIQFSCHFAVKLVCDTDMERHEFSRIVFKRVKLA
jgi:hypothetical protein